MIESFLNYCFIAMTPPFNILTSNDAFYVCEMLKTKRSEFCIIVSFKSSLV